LQGGTPATVAFVAIVLVSALGCAVVVSGGITASDDVVTAARFIDERGYWSDGLEQFLRLDPEYFDQYLAYSGHPWKDSELDAKTRAFVLLALHATPSNLDESGTRRYIGRALDAGATVDEILAVFELISPLGIHSVREAVPILAEEGGLPEPDEETAAEMKRLREEFEAERGYWAELWDQVMHLDHEYFEDVKETFSYPERNATLDPRVKEFVWVAIDITLTHIYEPGILKHVRTALEEGATHTELMEVFELASDYGVSTIEMATPILIEEAIKRGALQVEDSS
jgi:alkylhydroperoxidase/carboxymuconolactone decarboxylase family protein YurZ